MPINTVANIDCREFLDNNNTEYHYVYTSPPDFEEIGMDPGKDIGAYKEFILSVFDKLEPSSGLITIGATDRKYKKTLISKYKIFIDIMESLGYELVNNKIWVKGLGINYFRQNYSNVMTFAIGRKFEQNKVNEYDKDIWIIEREKVGGYTNHQPISIPSRCIEKYTKPGDIVLDPFMGTGTTAIAAKLSGRNFMGCELDKDVYNILTNRLTQIESLDSLFV